MRAVNGRVRILLLPLARSLLSLAEVVRFWLYITIVLLIIF
jgi:hypothetical protein